MTMMNQRQGFVVEGEAPVSEPKNGLLLKAAKHLFKKKLRLKKRTRATANIVLPNTMVVRDGFPKGAYGR